MKMRILIEFTGYPDGTEKSVKLFKPGEVDVPGDYADLLIKKGLAEEVGAASAPPQSTTVGAAPKQG